jgi:hypothetical protein
MNGRVGRVEAAPVVSASTSVWHDRILTLKAENPVKQHPCLQFEAALAQAREPSVKYSSFISRRPLLRSHSFKRIQVTCLINAPTVKWVPVPKLPNPTNHELGNYSLFSAYGFPRNRNAACGACRVDTTGHRD